MQQALDQLAKLTFRSRYAHTPVTEQSEGPMNTVASKQAQQAIAIIHLSRRPASECCPAPSPDPTAHFSHLHVMEQRQ